MKGFEHLEHTADVGIRAWAPTLEGCFEQATRGLLDIMGSYRSGRGEVIEVRQDARDLGGLLVDWLSEVLYVVDSRDARVTDVSVQHASATTVRGTITVASRTEKDDEGTAVKAITYHQLAIERSENGWTCSFFVDV